MIRCAACPAPPGSSCRASPADCRAIAAGDEGRRIAIGKLSARPTPRPPDDPVRLAMLAELCPMASGSCGCGSGPPRICSHPSRPREVRADDCRSCTAATAWEAGVEGVG